MSNYKYLFSIFILVSVSCKSYYHFAQGKASQQRITAAPDSLVSALILPYKMSMDSKMNEVIATCPVTLTKDRPESTLTNWFADAIHHQATLLFSEPVSFVYQNYGGIRSSEINRGNITLGKMFELMPFDNLFVLVQATGKEMNQLLKFIAESGGSPISSSLRFTIEGKNAVHTTLNGKPVSEDETYYIGLADFIANGGENLTFLKSLPRIDKNILIRDMLIQEARSVGTISSTLDRRIMIIK